MQRESPDMIGGGGLSDISEQLYFSPLSLRRGGQGVR